ncbi:prephenate/arogenate dehydrogenase family protein [Pacificimonas flava]|uniref:prephenate dehydrogenase n=1 Tax=Pacificimonas flava TaxID=1234595 RepID=M2U683_9SPHN|nr:prephenate/arogenate dehydrogenase family protein [Pacificimonas flava]EMD83518.1 Cyclohexadienyl dehydrogenase [Pacificimonas flava]MBB5278930.1 cyclohexadieny/prephenate dehydrogenase [Pacificimonas flava]
MLPFARLTIIGTGLIGSSLARAVRAKMPGVTLTGHDLDPDVRARAQALQLFDDIADSAGAAVTDADLVILAVPPLAMSAVADSLAGDLPPDAVISDVGSVKTSVRDALMAALPGPQRIVPAHPVAGTENSGPEAGFAELFDGRWCILTPPDVADPVNVERLAEFWRRLGSEIEIMTAEHHDMVLAVTSHLPHLIAYTIVGTASDVEDVTRSEVIKYSAGGFRDFTRIAASDPTMWRDVFLANKDAVLAMLQRFTEDLTALQRAIRWDDGDTLHRHFSATRDTRRRVIDAGQDTAAPDFGRGPRSA